MLDTPAGKLVALRAPQHGSGPGGNVIEWNNAVKPTSTAAGHTVNMMVDIAPPAFIPDAMWVVAEDTVVPANVPGIGGMPAHKGDIVQMIDTDGDALVDSYQILSSGHSVWEQLSTQALDPNAKDGDVFFETDTHAVGTVVETTAPSYDPTLPATKVLWTAAEIGAAWAGADSVFVGAEAPPNGVGASSSLYGFVTQGGASQASTVGHTLKTGGPYTTLIDHLVPVGYLPPADTLAIDYDPTTGIARFVDENGPLPDWNPTTGPNAANLHQDGQGGTLSGYQVAPLIPAGTLTRGPVLNERMIREWIIQSSLFEGTVGDIGTSLAHSVGYDTLVAASAANKGHTYIAAEAFTTVAGHELPAGVDGAAR